MDFKSCSAAHMRRKIDRKQADDEVKNLGFNYLHETWRLTATHG